MIPISNLLFGDGETNGGVAGNGRNLLMVMLVMMMGVTGMTGLSQVQSAGDRDEYAIMSDRLLQVAANVERGGERQGDIIRRLDLADMRQDNSGQDARLANIERLLTLLAADETARLAQFEDLSATEEKLEDLIYDLNNHIRSLEFTIDTLRTEQVRQVK